MFIVYCKRVSFSIQMTRFKMDGNVSLGDKSALVCDIFQPNNESEGRTMILLDHNVGII